VGPIRRGTRARLRGLDLVEALAEGKRPGVTLNFGRARRCHSEALREDIGTRYATCVGGNCDVPIRDCEIHHLVPVAAGGDTDAGNGVPLCRRKHHPQVTEGGYRLVPREGGGFDLLAPPGAELRPDRWRRRRTLGGP
jgi:hypothetical protein